MKQNYIIHMSVPVAARAKAYVCGRSPAEIVGLDPTGEMDGGLCDELITRPEEVLPTVVRRV